MYARGSICLVNLNASFVRQFKAQGYRNIIWPKHFTEVSIMLCWLIMCLINSDVSLGTLKSLSNVSSPLLLSPWSGLALLTCRWCGSEGQSWCKVTCLLIAGVGLRPGLTSPALGCFCSPQLMRIICRDAVEGCHKDLAQGVWENSRSVCHAQTQP